MIILRDLIDIFSTVIDAVVLYIFFGAMLGRKIVSEKKMVIFYTLYFFLTAFVLLVFDNRLLLFLSNFVLVISISFLYRSRSFTRIFACVIVAIMAVLTEILAGVSIAIATGKSVEILSTNLVYYVEGVLFSKALLLIFAKAVQYKKRPSGLRVSKTLILPLLALPLTTLFIIFVMSEYAYSLANNESVIVVSVASVLLIISNILVFFLFDKQLQQDEATRISTLAKQQLQYQTKYYKEIADKYKLSNKTIHDTKNLLFAISILLEKNEIEKAKSKIDELCNKALGTVNFVKSGNEALDALINAKAQLMQAMNISFKPSVFINTANQIEDLDLCIIIGNALDNSIEACSKIKIDKPKEIILKMIQADNLLTIEVINSSDEAITVVDGKAVTAKKDTLLHGFGLQNIEEITDKYAGSISVSQSDGLFTLKVYVRNEIA